MSLVEEFFKQHDELVSKYEKYTEVFKNQGAERPAEVAKYISLSRRKNAMPSPIYLIYFDGLLNDEFLLECMDYYLENTKRKSRKAKEAREQFAERDDNSNESIILKKPSKRRVAIKEYYRERALKLGL
ncbi:hypothetical protein SM121_04725 [Streptococcus sp. S1]|uniref:Phage protein n=1 Tax=Streptococcus dentalis TaxID=3098075 RepID=A0ABZ0T498_9STRE|nr:hypothetical protein [Streptococcus sp. S1]WPS54792.1 hypothetical protein SM121_04725 [Streptococcus sp. S1]